MKIHCTFKWKIVRVMYNTTGTVSTLSCCMMSFDFLWSLSEGPIRWSEAQVCNFLWTSSKGWPSWTFPAVMWWSFQWKFVFLSSSGAHPVGMNYFCWDCGLCSVYYDVNIILNLKNSEVFMITAWKLYSVEIWRFVIHLCTTQREILHLFIHCILVILQK